MPPTGRPDRRLLNQPPETKETGCRFDLNESGESARRAPWLTRIAGSEPGVDLLRVSTLGGDDDVTVAPDVADLIATAVDLGADES